MFKAFNREAFLKIRKGLLVVALGYVDLRGHPLEGA